MGRSYTEPEIKLVPQYISTYYLSRTRDPDDEFACEQAMTTFGDWRDVGPEGISKFLDHYIFDSKYAAYTFLEGYRIGRGWGKLQEALKQGGWK